VLPARLALGINGVSQRKSSIITANSAQEHYVIYSYKPNKYAGYSLFFSQKTWPSSGASNTLPPARSCRAMPSVPEMPHA
jgi:hypothetical protein